MMSKTLIIAIIANILAKPTIVFAQNSGCSGIYSEQTGTITSPNYPNQYPNSMNCSYYIESSPLYSVNIMFTAFATELCCDWVQVYCSIGSGKASPKFYGKTLPPYLSIQSCSRVAIQLYSDMTTPDTGFSLTYEIGSASVGGLSIRPMNVFVDKDSTGNIVLACKSDFNRFNSYPWWSFTSNSSAPRLITSSNCSLFASASSPLYNPVRQYPYGVCNLTISTVYVSSVVGTYTCTDSTLDSASAVVATLSAPQLVSVRNLSSPTTEVVKGDTFNVSCNMKAQQYSTSPQFQVRLYSSDQTDPSSYVMSDKSVSLMVTAVAEYLPTYICDTYATNFPDGCAMNQPENFSAKILGHQVQFWPQQDQMLISGDNNGKVTTNSPLTCYVPSYPAATYEWTHDSSVSQNKGPTMYVTRNGEYTCIAKNVIRGNQYQASKSVQITIDEQMNILALIIGVVLGAAVFIPMTIVIVALCCLCRRAKSSKDLVTDPQPSPAPAPTTPTAPLEDSASTEAKQHHGYEMTGTGVSGFTGNESSMNGIASVAYDNGHEVYERLEPEDDSSEGVRV